MLSGANKWAQSVTSRTVFSNTAKIILFSFFTNYLVLLAFLQVSNFLFISFFVFKEMYNYSNDSISKRLLTQLYMHCLLQGKVRIAYSPQPISLSPLYAFIQAKSVQ